MALTYTGTNGIFTAIGRLIKNSNLLLTDAQSWDAYLLNILDAFEAQDVTAPVERTRLDFDSAKLSVVSLRAALAASAESRLTDRDTVIEQLGISATNIDSVLAAMITQMSIDAASVNASVVSYVWPFSVGSPSGTGLIIPQIVMDGVTPPLLTGPAHRLYNGVNSELAVSETMRIECISDAGSGATPNEEQFQINGAVADQQWGTQTEGSGSGIVLQTANAARIVSNGDFEDFSTNTPGSWDIDAGTAGTHIYAETGASNIYLGSSGLKLTGNGVLAAITLSQTLASAGLTARKRYIFGVALKGALTAGTLELYFAGTGYSATAQTTEVQTLQISGTPTGGTYTISWRGQTTGTIAYNASSATVQTALRLLRGLEGVAVATSAGAAPDITHQITFHGVYDPEQITANITGLTGGTPAKTIATTTPWVTGDKISVPYAGIGSSWGYKWCLITMPQEIPDDWELVLKFSGTPANAENLYVDSIVLDEVRWHNGIGFAIIAGQTQFRLGDRFETTITNTEGVIQKFFRQWKGIQLPSNNAAAETIADSLAT